MRLEKLTYREFLLGIYMEQELLTFAEVAVLEEFGETGTVGVDRGGDYAEAIIVDEKPSRRRVGDKSQSSEG